MTLVGADSAAAVSTATAKAAASATTAKSAAAATASTTRRGRHARQTGVVAITSATLKGTKKTSLANLGNMAASPQCEIATILIGLAPAGTLNTKASMAVSGAYPLQARFHLWKFRIAGSGDHDPKR